MSNIWDRQLEEALRPNFSRLILAHFEAALNGDTPFPNAVELEEKRVSISKLMGFAPSDVGIALITEIWKLIVLHGVNNLDLEARIDNLTNKEAINDSEMPDDLTKNLLEVDSKASAALFRSISELVIKLVKETENLPLDFFQQAAFIYFSLAFIMPNETITYLCFLTEYYDYSNESYLRRFMETVLEFSSWDLDKLRKSDVSAQLKKIERFVYKF